MRNSPLNIERALALHQLLFPYLPEKMDGDDRLATVARQILEKMTPDDYLKVVSLVSGIHETKLLKMKSQRVLALFIRGLIVNQFGLLNKFCRTLG